MQSILILEHGYFPRRFSFLHSTTHHTLEPFGNVVPIFSRLSLLVLRGKETVFYLHLHIHLYFAVPWFHHDLSRLCCHCGRRLQHLCCLYCFGRGDYIRDRTEVEANDQSGKHPHIQTSCPTRTTMPSPPSEASLSRRRRCAWL